MFGIFFSEGNFSNFSTSLIILEISFLLTFPMAYLAFLYFGDLALALKPREVINPFPDLSNLIKESKKIEKLPYEKKRPKHEPTYSYFDLARQIPKCMMRSNTLNWHNYGGYKKMTSPSSNVNSTDEDESKQSIVNKHLSQNCSAEVDKLCSTEIDKSEYTHVPNFNVSTVF